MPDDKPVTPPPAPPEVGTAAPSTVPSGPTIHIGDEFGTAKRNLPPPKIVAIGIAALAVVAAVVVFTQSRPTSHGTIDNVSAVEIPNQNSVLVTINLTLRNGGKKPLYIHTMKATLTTDSGPFSDEAASPMDFERYFQAFPDLRKNAIAPLQVETKVMPGAETKGTIVVSFPVSQDVFNKRKSLAVAIQPYDEQAVIIRQ
jgi:hypothetical protein